VAFTQRVETPSKQVSNQTTNPTSIISSQEELNTMARSKKQKLCVQQQQPSPACPPSSGGPLPLSHVEYTKGLGIWGVLPRDAELSILSFLPYENIISLSLTCSTLYHRDHHVHVPDRLVVHRKNLSGFLKSHLSRNQGGRKKTRVVMRRMETFRINGIDRLSSLYMIRTDLFSGVYQLPFLFPNLVSLNLSDSLMSTDGINRLLDAVKRSPWKSLRELHVANNCINEAVRKKVVVGGSNSRGGRIGRP